MIYWILLVALILRLITLNQSLWLDEAINVLAAKNLGFWQYVTGYPLGDFHPPGYFALLWIWTRAFGFSEIAVRLPSVILGVGTVGLTYLSGKELFSKRVGLLAGLLITLAPLHLYYSQEARMYSLAAFSVALSYYLFFKIIRDGHQYLFFYGCSVMMVLYSDYVAYLALASQLVSAVLFYPAKLKSIILGLLGGAISILPWLLIFPQQLFGGEQTVQRVSGWAKVVGGTDLKNFLLIFIKTIVGRVSFSDKLVYGLVVVPIGIFYSFIVGQGLRKITRGSWLLLIWFFLPIFGAYLISLTIPVLSYFRMIFILPALYLLLACGFTKLNNQKFRYLLIVFLLINFIFIGGYYLNPAFQREDWRGLVKFLNQQNLNNTLILFEDSNLPAPFKYYNQTKITSSGALKTFPARQPNDVVDFEKVNNIEKVYLVNYLVEISDPRQLVRNKLINLNYVLSNTYDFPGVGFIYEYVRSN